MIALSNKLESVQINEQTQTSAPAFMDVDDKELYVRFELNQENIKYSTRKANQIELMVW